MIRAPVIPKGWPRAIAPPNGLSFSSSIPSVSLHGTICAANASLISTTSMSIIDMPVFFSSCSIAGIGPRPMTSGRIAATVEATIRARGLKPAAVAFSSLITSSAAAPSLSGQALPAVTVPPSLNTGFSDASFSSVVPGARAVVLGDDRLGHVDLVALPVDVFVRRHGHRDDLLVEVPDSCAATARVWEMSAHSSWASRLTFRSSATFSAVMPIEM